jgi:carboxymethylenebutenolidase
MKNKILPIVLLLLLSAIIQINAETVVVQNGKLKLHAQIWRPDGKGKFPGILFNHGRGGTPHPEILAPLFVKHGYVFLAIARRGEWISADQGEFINNLLDHENEKKGAEAAKQLQVKLMETDHLNDALAGLAYLKKLPYVDANRIAVVGHSFGGSLTLLLSERDHSIRAAVNFGGAAASWDESPYLRERLISAVEHVSTPMFFIFAANDFSTNPGKALSAEMARLKKTQQLKIYPALGQTPNEGHALIYRGVQTWENDVFKFLKKYVQERK